MEELNGSTSVLYLNAGDTYTGTPWFTLYKDQIVTEFMNHLRPDVAVSNKTILLQNIENNFDYLVFRKS